VVVVSHARNGGAAYFIPTVVVPLLFITHGLVFRLLLQGDRGELGRSSAPQSRRLSVPTAAPRRGA
jgi:hypothetical protein